MKNDPVLEDLLGEYYALEERETPEAFIARHAEHADVLREHFALNDLVEHAFEPRTELPERIGPFRIEAELGTGGMGTVYRAVVDEPERGFTVGDTVALKVVHPHLFRRRGFFKRFLREAELGRRIDHANVVRTLDVDAVESGDRAQHYLVMEYVEGQTLRGLMDDLDRVPEELARHIGCEVAKALSAIHAAGAVHRDLKPENVLITADQVVKVMDLGVARLADEQVRLSQTGAFVGSLHYAAPEQFSSKTEVDFRADLHGLGLLLYEIATGTNPYAHEDVSVSMRHILTETPRKAGELNPQLSPFFEEMLVKLLEKDPEARFASAEDVLGVLEEAEQSAWWHDRAKEVRTSSKQPLRRIRIPRETAVYGRDDDLAKLHVLYEKAKGGDGRVLLIEGEAGIGKTRLVDEFVSRLRQEGEDINFVFASYPPGGAATASGAFSKAYREHFGEENLEDTLKDHLKPTPVLVPAFAALLRGEPTPAGAEALTKDSVQTVFVHATRSIAAERTTIVLIDDLHFAPEDGRALFSSLAMAVSGHRILLLGTMRPGVPEAWTVNVTRLDQAEQWSLARLGPKDLASLLQDAFRSERLAEELGFRIAKKSDGNPFFAFEIIRGLKEGQFITQRPDGSWHTTQLIEDIQVPSSILDLVNARVSGLTEDERSLLDVAACRGYEFDPTLVGEVLGLGRIPVLRTLAQIERAHRLVRSAGRNYVFDHHQVQEALYGSLNERLQEEYHAALAETLEDRFKAADADPAELDDALCLDLCDHFLKGGRGERALRYLDVALDYLHGSYLHGQVIALANCALGTDGLLGGTARVRVLLLKDNTLTFLGRREEQEVGLTEASALAVEAEDQAVLMQVELALGRLRVATGRYEDAREHQERCLTIATRIGERRGETRANANLGHVLRLLGRNEDARERSKTALALASEAGYRYEEACAEGHLGNVLSDLGRLEEAREHYERSLEISNSIEDRQGEASAAGNLGIVSRRLGRFEEARVYCERSLTTCREIGERAGEFGALANLSTVYLSLARYEEAQEYSERALAIAREIGDPAGQSTVNGNLGLAYLGRGRYERAREYLERWLAASREHGVAMGEAVALVNLGFLWLALGAPAKARHALEASLALSQRIGTRYPEGYALFGLGSAAHEEEGQDAQAIDLAGQALALRREIGHGDGIADSLVQLAEFRWAAGDTDASRDVLLEAVGLLRQQQRKGELAHALALLACLPQGDAEAAEAALEDADESSDTPQVRYLLWKATGKQEHLLEAKRLLDHLVEHAPEEYRESMLKNVRLNREIMEAWGEHGGKAEKEGEVS